MGHRMIRGMDRRSFTLSLLAAAAAISSPAAAQNTAALRVNGKRLSDHLAALSEFGKNPFGGVSRIAYTEADKQGRVRGSFLPKFYLRRKPRLRSIIR